MDDWLNAVGEGWGGVRRACVTVTYFIVGLGIKAWTAHRNNLPEILPFRRISWHARELGEVLCPTLFISRPMNVCSFTCSGEDFPSSMSLCEIQPSILLYTDYI